MACKKASGIKILAQNTINWHERQSHANGKYHKMLWIAKALVLLCGAIARPTLSLTLFALKK
jgi:hypothetical protein